MAPPVSNFSSTHPEHPRTLNTYSPVNGYDRRYPPRPEPPDPPKTMLKTALKAVAFTTFLYLLLIGLFLLILLIAQPAYGQLGVAKLRVTHPEVIHSPTLTSNSRKYGSCVCIDKTETERYWFFYTARHNLYGVDLARDRVEVDIRGQWYPVTAFKKHETQDVAFLNVKCPLELRCPGVTTEMPKPGEQVRVAGFPRGGQLKILEGVFDQDRWLILHNTQGGQYIEQGFSGGGVYNSEGQLIGIQTAAMDHRTLGQRDRQMGTYTPTLVMTQWHEQRNNYCPPGTDRCPAIPGYGNPPDEWGWRPIPQTRQPRNPWPQTPPPQAIPFNPGGQPQPVPQGTSPFTEPVPTPIDPPVQNPKPERTDISDLWERVDTLQTKQDEHFHAITDRQDSILGRISQLEQDTQARGEGYENRGARVQIIEQNLTELSDSSDAALDVHNLRIQTNEQTLSSIQSEQSRIIELLDLLSQRKPQAGPPGPQGDSIVKAWIDSGSLYFETSSGVTLAAEGDLLTPQPHGVASLAVVENKIHVTHHDGSVHEIEIVPPNDSALDTIRQRLDTLEKASARPGPPGTVTVIVKDSGEEQATYNDLESGSTVVVDIDRYREEED